MLRSLVGSEMCIRDSSFNYAACGGRCRGQFINQGNARPRVRCYARSGVSSGARTKTPLVLTWRSCIHEGGRIGMQQKTSRTSHQPRQCSIARAMSCSKLRRVQSPRQNVRSPQPKKGPTDIKGNTAVKARTKPRTPPSLTLYIGLRLEP